MNKTEMRKELLLKERRVTFWEKHHRLIPKEEETLQEITHNLLLNNLVNEININNEMKVIQ